MAKLIRDKIPEIITKSTNQKPKITILKNDQEYLKALCDKLKEETSELLEAIKKQNSENEIEEIADVLEVIDAIIALKKYDSKDIIRCKLKKLKERGGFKKRIMLS